VSFSGSHARHRPTEIVHDDAGSARGEEQGVLLAQPSAGSGDDRDLFVVFCV